MDPLYSARHSSEQLTVLVVGAGISALATAYALQRAGHSCTVLDPNPAGHPEQGGGGTLVSPNASRLLSACGIAQDLLHDAIPLQKFTFTSHTEKSSAQCSFDPELLQDPTATFVFSEHAAVVDRLRYHAISAGAQFLHDHRVVGVSAETCQVTLANGKSLKADLLVGADGANSIVRRSLFPPQSLKSKKGIVYASTTISNSHLDQHPSTKDLANRRSLAIWANNECLATVHPVQNGDALALSLYYPSRPATDAEEGGSSDPAWKQSALTPEIRGMFSGWGQTFSTLLSAVDSVWTCEIFESVPLEVFHFPPDEDENSAPKGFAVLVGDAAHVVTPGVLNLASILEDAAVLGSLLSRYDPTSPPTELWTLISAYTSIRLERKTSTSLEEFRSVFNAVLPDGVEPPAQLNDSDDDPVGAKVWEQFAAAWSYDAFEDAEEWWALWKLPADRSEAALSAAGSDSEDTAEPAALYGDGAGKLLDPVEVKRRSRVGSVSVDISVSVVRGS